MGYYIRILTPATAAVSAATLRKALRGVPEVVIEFSGAKTAFASAFVGGKAAPDEDPVLTIERDVVEPGSMGEEELEEFDGELSGALPRSGARWVRAYLEKVRTIYAIQIHSGASRHPGVVDCVVEAIRGAAGGIVQADSEGFSNEDGSCVVWQFSEAASGPWTMAVLDARSRWVTFEMDLGNAAERKAFLRGSAPPSRAGKGSAKEKPRPH